MDHTRTEQSEQDKNELNNTPAWNRAASTKPVQTKLAKQNKANKIRPDQVSRTVRTPPDHHGEKQSDRRDQDRTVKPDLIKTETRQAKPNRVATPNILRKATAYDIAITLPDQPSASTASRTA